MITPQQISDWLKDTVAKSRSGTPVFEGWDRRLWSKPYDEIVEFLQTRFETTLSEPEYYLSILYLRGVIGKESLHIPFKQSPQYQRMLSGSSKGINIATTPKGMKKGAFSVKIQPFSVKIRGV